MNLRFTSVWELMLWIAAIEAITCVLVAMTVNTIRAEKYRLRETYFARFSNAFSKALEEAGKTLRGENKQKDEGQ